jgi:ferrous-iron efflux pump FieF
MMTTTLTHQQGEQLVRWATYASVTVAAILIGIKFLAWWITQALSLQATLIDSILDAAASIINLIAVHKAQQPATHPYRFGFGKAEAIAALGQSIFIALSAGWLIFQAMGRFWEPLPLQESSIGLIVMIVAMALTSGLILFQRYVITHTRSTAIEADSLHYRSDFLINGGVLFSLLAGSFLEWDWLDPVFATFIAIYILYTAWQISAEAICILMDRELPEKLRERIRIVALSHPEVKGLHDLRTRSSGTKHFIQLHLEVEGGLTLDQVHAIADQVETSLLKEFPRAEILIHQDPVGLRECH